MTIGIITVQRAPNYGACLQAFALYKFLEDDGHQVEMIDLYRPYFDSYQKSKKYKPASIHRGETLSRKVKRYIKILIGREKIHSNNISNTQKKKNQIIAEKKFEDFCNQINYSAPYYGPDQLYHMPPIYDAYLTGSDQVWNPTQRYCIEPYFLTFAPANKKKFSYASSMGITELTWSEKRKFKRWLSQYNSISVREEKAAEILNRVSGQKIEVVADPTFLLPQPYWESIAKVPEFDDYILIFTLQKDIEFIKYGEKLSLESGKHLVVMGLDYDSSLRNDNFTLINDAGIEEFLGIIKNAHLVITDSFHCTVFSLILGVNHLYSYIYPWNMRGSRITNLLHTFDLDDRLMDVDLEQSYTELTKSVINKSFIASIIEEQRKHSISFLRNCLK